MPYDVLSPDRPGTAAHPSTLRHLMREVAQPVAVISGRACTGGSSAGALAAGGSSTGAWSGVDSSTVAMTVSAFTSVSLDPPLILFCPSRRSRSWAAIAASGRFVLNVLREDQAEVAAALGGRRHSDDMGPGPGLPAAVRWHSAHGLPALADAVATAGCRVAAVHPGGDHHVVVAAVESVRRGARGRPLSYWRGAYATVGPHAVSGTGPPADALRTDAVRTEEPSPDAVRTNVVRSNARRTDGQASSW